MSEHRWGAAAVADLDEDQAAEFARMDMPARVAWVSALAHQVVTAVRGPLCAECRVAWETVYVRPDQPWPCPGRRPDEIGGPLLPAERPVPRQQRRSERREANEIVEAAKRLPGRPTAEQIKQQLDGAVQVASMRSQSAKAALATDPVDVKLLDPPWAPPERVRLS